jgi:hypothetical protein
MKPSNRVAALCIAAAAASASSYAKDHREERSDERHQASQLQVVPVSAKAGEPGYGWRYFSDVREGRAAVISPDGDYYYSHGQGLELVFKGSGAP